VGSTVLASHADGLQNVRSLMVLDTGATKSLLVAAGNKLYSSPISVADMEAVQSVDTQLLGSSEDSCEGKHKCVANDAGRCMKCRGERVEETEHAEPAAHGGAWYNRRGISPSDIVKNTGDGTCGVAEQKEFCYDQATLRAQRVGFNAPSSKWQSDLNGNCQCDAQKACRTASGRCEFFAANEMMMQPAYQQNLDGSCSCADTEGVCTRMMRSVPDQIANSEHCFFAEQDVQSMSSEGISLAQVAFGEDGSCGCAGGVMIFVDSLYAVGHASSSSETDQCSQSDGGSQAELAQSDISRNVVCGSKCPDGQLPLFNGVCRPVELSVEGNKGYPVPSGEDIDIKLHVVDSWGTKLDVEANKWSKKTFKIETAHGEHKPDFCYWHDQDATEEPSEDEDDVQPGDLKVEDISSDPDTSGVAQLTGKVAYNKTSGSSDMSRLWVQATMEVEYESGADMATSTLKSPCFDISARPGPGDFALHQVATISGVSGLAIKNSNEVFAASSSMHTVFAIDLSLSFRCDTLMSDPDVTDSFKAWQASSDERVNQWPPPQETFQFQPNGDASRWYVNAYKKSAVRSFDGVDTELTKQLLCFQEVTNAANPESCCVIKNLNIPQGQKDVLANPEARAALKAW
jgi:hypothetical protein